MENKVVPLKPGLSLVPDAEQPKGPRNAFDQARDLLASYEKAMIGKSVPRILILIDAPELLFGVAGEGCRPSDAAGLLCAAQTMVLTEMAVHDASPRA